MFGRRGKHAAKPVDAEHEDADTAEDVHSADSGDANGALAEDGGSAEDAQVAVASGPHDEADIDDSAQRVDLGGLRITGREGLQVRLQMDERTKQVASAVLILGDSAVELRAFAAARSEPLWDEVRASIAAEASKRGGQATESQGPFGTELAISMPAKTKDGRDGRQRSRVVGVNGPRWMLRGTFLGRAAQDAKAAEEVEKLFRDVVVVRGHAPMAPGDVLALELPKGMTAPGQQTEQNQQQAAQQQTSASPSAPSGQQVPSDHDGSADD